MSRVHLYRLVGAQARREIEEESRKRQQVVAEKRIEYVRWIDSVSIGEGRWIGRDAIDPAVMTAAGITQGSVGFVLDESEDVLLLAQSVGDQVGGILAIPKTAITERHAWT